MFRYESRRMLRTQRDFAETELARVEGALNTQADTTQAVVDLARSLSSDRQAAVEAYWLQYQKARFAFMLQIGGILSLLLVTSIGMTIYAYTSVYPSLAVLPMLFSIALAVGVVKMVMNMQDPEGTVTLPSGEVIEVSSATQARLRDSYLAMAAG